VRSVVTDETDPRVDRATVTGEGLVLIVTSGGRTDSVTLAPGLTFVIGRAEDATLVIDDPAVSRYHAQIEAGPPPTITDLGSRNGTSIGDVKLIPREGVALREGDVVRIGHAVLVLQSLKSQRRARHLTTRPLRDDIAERERALILQTLAECDGNQTEAARRLQISRSTLNQRLDAYRVPRPRKKVDPV
jgi:pSer/pThr/pTyr-binding forkhead associated (FHA) protein